jgi:hypothetical protein
MNESRQTREARENLALGLAATAAGQRAAGHYVRRYLVGLGALFACWLLVLAAISRWLDVGSAATAVIIGATVAMLAGVVLIPARRQPVRARVAGGAAGATLAAGALLFGAFAALSPDLPAVTAAGALVVFAYWAACAWWFGRAG